MPRKLKRTFHTLLLCLFSSTLYLSSCASIPGEAPELSAELGKRITSIETAHINLLHGFFHEKKVQVDRFITEEWLPTFAEQFFSNEDLAKVWDEVVLSNDKAERLEFIVRVGPKIQGAVNEKRNELINPLEEIEKSIELDIRAEYEQAKAINNSITSFLLSASRVDENRKRYLEAVGVTDRQVAQALEDIDSAVNGLLKKARTIKDKENSVEEYLKKLETITNSLK